MNFKWADQNFPILKGQKKTYLSTELSHVDAKSCLVLISVMLRIQNGTENSKEKILQLRQTTHRERAELYHLLQTPRLAGLELGKDLSRFSVLRPSPFLYFKNRHQTGLGVYM